MISIKQIANASLASILAIELTLGGFVSGRLYEQDVWMKFEESRKSQNIDNNAESIARRLARANQMDEELILAIMWQESGWNHNVVSSRGAIGLMQIMPDTAKDLKINPYDMIENISGGIRYLKWIHKQGVDTLEGILIAYNWGIGNYRKHIKHGKALPRETEEYVKCIRSHMKKKPWIKKEL